MNAKLFQHPLLKVKEVARILNISRALAYRLVQQGALPCVKIESARRVRAEDLQRYIEEHSTLQ